MAKVRVLVVDDSLTVRRRLCDLLASDPQIDVVGEAADGKRAIELCAELRPDVVTLDMMLPVMSGLAATEYIMAHCPTPILIVSLSTNRGEVFKTYDALAAGAVDVLDKPAGGEAADEWERRFVATVKLVSRIKVITHPRARLGLFAHPNTGVSSHSLPPATNRAVRAVAIGASTGGPAAVLEILRALPAKYPLPILLVIHIGEPFGSAFADWLDAQTPHRVAYAVDGELLSGVAGRVAMAPPNQHLTVAGGRLRLSMGPERHSCRPSVDVLFESLAQESTSGGDFSSALRSSAADGGLGRGQADRGVRAPGALLDGTDVRCGIAACLLTGMGRDGAAGLLAIRRAGGVTIAQDEASSVVYGMPREAAQIGAAERILPLADIGPALAAFSADDARARP